MTSSRKDSTLKDLKDKLSSFINKGSSTAVEFPQNISSNDVLLSTLESSFLSALEKELKPENNDGIATIETLKVQASEIAELNRSYIAASTNTQATSEQKRNAYDKLNALKTSRNELINRIKKNLEDKLLEDKLKVTPKDKNSLPSLSCLCQYEKFLTYKEGVERAIANLKLLEDIKNFNEAQKSLLKDITDGLGQDIHNSDFSLLDLYKTSLPTEVGLIQDEIKKQEINLPVIENDYAQSIREKKLFLDDCITELQKVVGHRVTGYQQQLQNVSVQFDISKENLDMNLLQSFKAELEKSKKIEEEAVALHDKINSEYHRRKLDVEVRKLVGNFLKCTQENSFDKNKELKQKYEAELEALLKGLISRAANNLNSTAENVQSAFMYQRHIVVERYNFLQQVWSLNQGQLRHLESQKGYKDAEDAIKKMSQNDLENVPKGKVTLAHKLKISKVIEAQYDDCPADNYSLTVCNKLKPVFTPNIQSIMEAHRGEGFFGKIWAAVKGFLFKTRSQTEFFAPVATAMNAMDASIQKLSQVKGEYGYATDIQLVSGSDDRGEILEKPVDFKKGFSKK